MTWARLDDNFTDHPKVDVLSDGAFRLHTSGIVYSARHLTDGIVPADRVPRLVPNYRKKHLEELLAEVWHSSDSVCERCAKKLAELGHLLALDDYVIHDWLHRNPSAAKVQEEREAAAERMRSRRGSGERSGEVRTNTRRTFGAGSSSPTRPEGSRGGSSSSESVDRTSSDASGDDVEAQAQHDPAAMRASAERLRGLTNGLRHGNQP